ncbi:hypothetical protein [Streptomyces amakusaensis]|uniref:Uncharacterized protein n=1 Tax=Streptomyces amakusaensis TaxID=67271 RepID=A0ABW0AKR0_9ACTN
MNRIITAAAVLLALVTFPLSADAAEHVSARQGSVWCEACFPS